MQQRDLRPGGLNGMPQAQRKAFFQDRKTRWDGSPSSIVMRSAKADSPEQRETEFERLWQEGGFAFWTSNYMDLFVDQESNSIVYGFWKRKVRSRITDEKLWDVLAPDVQPYAFGTKRVPLEQNYYEAFNLANVDLVDLQQDDIDEITSDGVKLASGKTMNLDILVLATGFDISTGSFTQIDIRGKDDQKLTDKWVERPRSYLGMSVSGFPNMLFSYGPQSPSNTCNGPVCAEVQGDWIADLLEHAKASGATRLEATEAAEQEYTDLVTGLLEGTLFKDTKSYYYRDDVAPSGDRKREPIFWMGGLPAYIQKLDMCREDGYSGFTFSCLELQ
jgi:cation diffusion facilitator CzcD-associated flavoprotein CzcO